ncbi:hypothetical protein [Bacillus sp. FJAT-52991]|uniref:ABC transporter permease n=1 Tax=Bacillus kandeliae TaxID=3129297 RepID=A0ABZ2N2Y9_9BACI
MNKIFLYIRTAIISSINALFICAINRILHFGTVLLFDAERKTLFSKESLIIFSLIFLANFAYIVVTEQDGERLT